MIIADKIKKFSLALSFGIAALSMPMHASPDMFKATASIDSTVMLMGSKAMMTVEFTGPLSENSHIEIPENQDKDVEITPNDAGQMTEVSSGRKTLKEIFTVQIFDSGLYTIQPVICISGTDTVYTNAPVIKVDPVALDSVNVVEENGKLVDLKIHDYTDVTDVKSKFFDFLPDWVQSYGWSILLAVILIAGFIFVYLKWLRHGKIPLMPVKKPVPPYELAISQLNELQSKQLWQKGAEKEYYTQLTEILRGYLAGRFGINAMEMTSPQIAEAIADNEYASEYAMLVNTVLFEADFVKFAKAKPMADQNQQAFSSTRKFIELTKPVEITEGGKDTNKEEQNVSETERTEPEQN